MGMLTSKVTTKLQTTLPSSLAKILGVHPGEELGYIVEGPGLVRLVNASQLSEEDPTIMAFLDLLSRDLQDHPERLEGLGSGLLERARSLTARVTIEHDDPILGPVGL